MRRSVVFLLTACVLLFTGGCVKEESDNDRIQALTDYFSSDVKELDAQIAELRRQSALLPETYTPQRTNRTGYQSRASDANAPRDRSKPDTRTILLDLGSRQPIDNVVLVPADYAVAPAGYGFPLRFRVEVSDDLAFEEEYGVLVDHTGEDFPNPRRSPVVIPAERVKMKDGAEVHERVETRYVRLTATRLWTSEGRSLLAMGEIMVLQGGRNIAAGLPAENIKTTNYGVEDSIESPPAWSRENLVDGQSVIGAPQGNRVSPTRGYQSLADDSPETPGWIMVDLDHDAPIHEIRLFPALSPQDFAAQGGFGFPERFRVEVAPASDPSFSQPIVVYEDDGNDFPNPQENPVSIRVQGTVARYVKITATQLRERFYDYLLAMAEIQVFSGGENIALGAGVSVKNAAESQTWAPRFVTDGYTSRRNILSWPEYVTGLQKRRVLAAAVRELQNKRRRVGDRVLRTTLEWSLAGIGGAVLVSVLLVWRHRRSRRRDLSALRRRLAQDIHDEIGSGLGTISLLSQMGGGNDSHDEGAREDFMEIHRISRTVTESLRDIVWFIHPQTRTVGDLAQRLKETAHSMLAGISHEFNADCPTLRNELPLEHKRQILMFFKEALHNVIRHSGTARAEITMAGDGKNLRICIRDFGRGFDPEAPRAGAGMIGMKQRAKTLGGRLTIKTALGDGAALTLEVPWRPVRKNAPR